MASLGLVHGAIILKHEVHEVYFLSSLFDHTIWHPQPGFLSVFFVVTEEC